MKTKQVPAIIMLIAGLVVSIVAAATHMETMQFLKILVIVLVVFYIAGCVVKVILDKNFKEEVEDAGSETEAEENEEAEESEEAVKKAQEAQAEK